MTLTVCSSHQQPPKCWGWGCSLCVMTPCGARYRLQDLTDGRKALQQVKHIAGPVGWFCSWLYPPCLKLTPAKDSSERHICRPNTKKERKCAFLTSSFAALACGRSSRLNKSWTLRPFELLRTSRTTTCSPFPIADGNWDPRGQGLIQVPWEEQQSVLFPVPALHNCWL